MSLTKFFKSVGEAAKYIIPVNEIFLLIASVINILLGGMINLALIVIKLILMPLILILETIMGKNPAVVFDKLMMYTPVDFKVLKITTRRKR